MIEAIKVDDITIEVTLPVETYEDLLAGARVIHEDIDFFVEALITLYSREFVQNMMKAP
jgi:hypothetical protein